MYVSGMVVAFILVFIITSIQANQRRKVSGESIGYAFLGVIFGSIIGAILSWFTVLIIIVFFLTGRLSGINYRN